jgi:hypothetical protein
MAEISLSRLDGADDVFYHGKVAAARIYMARVLPQTDALFAMVAAGAPHGHVSRQPFGSESIPAPCRIHSQ